MAKGNDFRQKSRQDFSGALQAKQAESRFRGLRRVTLLARRLKMHLSSSHPLV
jgi:hypothetical protein